MKTLVQIEDSKVEVPKIVYLEERPSPEEPEKLDFEKIVVPYENVDINVRDPEVVTEWVCRRLGLERWQFTEEERNHVTVWRQGSQLALAVFRPSAIDAARSMSQEDFEARKLVQAAREETLADRLRREQASRSNVVHKLDSEALISLWDQAEAAVTEAVSEVEKLRDSLQKWATMYRGNLMVLGDIRNQIDKVFGE